tara:strand:- start:1889 stop:2098 length:210 start_codon:yes stop_codon:yes gene_type:complete
MKRMNAILSLFNRKQAKQKREKMMNHVLVKSVDTNANGTSGYTVKNGPNKGKVLGHITVKHPNKILTGE